MSTARSFTNKLHSQVDKYNKQHSCAPAAINSHRKSSNTTDQHLQFIDSMVAPKKFFNHITIEPLAFLAILALYIEFPSIQDLIYTKICLQVVAQYPNLTSQYQVTSSVPISTNLTMGQQNSLSDKTMLRPQTIINFPIDNFTRQLPTNGRIQQSENQPISFFQKIPNISDHESRDHFLCDRLNKTAIPKNIRQEIIDGDSLFWLKYQLTICLLCAITSPYWGGMSDRIGRLIPLNVPLIMSIISNLISLIFGVLISLNSHTLFRVEWLYLGAVLIGISGGQAVLIVTSFSFISDNTSSESRSKRVSVLESVIYLSHSVGFYTTKHIMSLGLASPGHPWFNRHFVAFSACVILNLFCVLYSVFKLRHYKFHRFLNNFEREQQEAFAGDTLSISNSVTSGLGQVATKNIACNEGNVANADRLRELTSSTPDDLDGPIARSDKSWSDWGTVLTVKYYKETYLTTTKRRESRSIILSLLLCGFISAMSLASLMSLLYIYVRMDPFNWTTSQYSSWNSITSITRGLALVALTLSMKFLKGWNAPDPIVAAVGFLSKGIGLFMIAVAQSSTIINWALLAFVMSEFSMPPIRSLLSKLVIREEVGKVYSCLAAIQSICFLVGNVIFYLAYTSLNLQDFFRLSFLVVAGFQLGAVIIMLVIYFHLKGRVIII